MLYLTLMHVIFVSKAHSNE